MNNNIAWIFELTLTNGTADDLKTLMVELADSAKNNEPDTLIYEWTLSEDNKVCHIHERYKDSQAAILHLGTFRAKFAARLMALGNSTGFVLYGNASDALKAELEGFNGKFMTPIGGFIR